jgi:hypothetical protein
MVGLTLGLDIGSSVAKAALFDADMVEVATAATPVDPAWVDSLGMETRLQLLMLLTVSLKVRVSNGLREACVAFLLAEGRRRAEEAAR